MLRTLSSIISFESFRLHRKEWLLFWKGVLGSVGLSLLVLIGGLEFICWRTGESMDYKTAAALQQKNLSLIWNARDSFESRFKLLRLSQENPDVITMGHSRMAQFRSAMFHPYRFYDDARTSWRWDMYSDLLERIVKVAKPKVILFSLDFTSFNPAYTKYYEGISQQFDDNRTRDHLDALYDISMILYTHPKAILAGSHEPRFGLPAIGIRPALFSYGFRGDGSETDSVPVMRLFGYGTFVNTPIPPNQEPFFYGDKMGEWEKTQFERFAKIARDNGIQLVGIQMPMHCGTVSALEKNPHLGILRDFRAHIADGYFQKQGVIVFDYLDFLPYTEDYHYFMDRTHTGEVVSAAVLRSIWLSNSRVRELLPNLDIKALDEKINEDWKNPRHAEAYGQEF